MSELGRREGLCKPESICHVWEGSQLLPWGNRKPGVPDFSRAVRLFNAEILIFNHWELILDKYNVTVQASNTYPQAAVSLGYQFVIWLSPPRYRWENSRPDRGCVRLKFPLCVNTLRTPGAQVSSTWSRALVTCPQRCVKTENSQIDGPPGGLRFNWNGNNATERLSKLSEPTLLEWAEPCPHA